VNRIRLSNTQFKVSRPGFNVDTATPEQIAFDGFSGDPYAGVYLSGETNTEDGSWTTVQTGSFFFPSAISFRKIKTINLGKTFSQPPQVLWTLREIGNQTLGGYAKYSHVANTGQAGNNIIAGTTVWASCTTTQLILRVEFPVSGIGITNWLMSYVVFQT